jgi:hypothetical protein
LVLDLWAGLKRLSAAGADLGGHQGSPYKKELWEPLGRCHPLAPSKEDGSWMAKSFIGFHDSSLQAR